MGVTIWWTVWGVVSAAAVCWALKKHPHPIRGWLGSCAQGLCALAAVNVAGGITGVSLGVNALSLATSALLGFPGVVGLLGLQCICG
jgi:hypothetical protein